LRAGAIPSIIFLLPAITASLVKPGSSKNPDAPFIQKGRPILIDQTVAHFFYSVLQPATDNPSDSSQNWQLENVKQQTCLSQRPYEYGDCG
jgi:hypothetical protein